MNLLAFLRESFNGKKRDFQYKFESGNGNSDGYLAKAPTEKKVYSILLHLDLLLELSIELLFDLLQSF
jgi:hypothetical protein